MTSWRFLPFLCGVMAFGAGCAAQEPAASVDLAPKTAAEAVTERVVQTDSVRGFYVTPTEHEDDLPGILTIHEWWGLNDQIKDEARALAAQGYAVFAIDLYDGEVAADAATAGRLAGAVRGNPDAAIAKMRAALDYLAAQPNVDGQRLASLGWCFGGGMSAQIGAIGDPRLKATVIYYGTPITDESVLKKIDQPVLGIWGEDDQSIPVENARAFELALKKQGTSAEFYYYPDAGHAFANPTRSDSYRPEQTADAWQKTLAFLKRNLDKR